MGSELSHKLIAYSVVPSPPEIRPAIIQREWMTAANQTFPYRCLPLTIANQLGWDVINPVGFTAFWNGGSSPKDIVIETMNKTKHPFLVTHFGIGVITFTLGYLFKTSPGHNLIFTGPCNHPYHGLTPCTGVVETDWLPATSTMNWLCSPNQTVYIPAGAPICRLIPYPRHYIEDFSIEVRDLKDNQELEEQYRVWSARRDKFNKDLHVAGSDATKDKWQKDYFQGGGKLADQGVWPRFEEHQTKLEIQKPVDYREIQDLHPVNKEYDWRVASVAGRPIWVRQQLPNQEK